MQIYKMLKLVAGPNDILTDDGGPKDTGLNWHLTHGWVFVAVLPGQSSNTCTFILRSEGNP